MIRALANLDNCESGLRSILLYFVKIAFVNKLCERRALMLWSRVIERFPSGAVKRVSVGESYSISGSSWFV